MRPESVDWFGVFCYICIMSDSKKKKELHRVHVIVTDSSGTDELIFRIVVPPDSTTDKEMEWRMEWLKGYGTYGIESDKIIKES